MTMNFLGLFFFGLTIFSCLSVRMTDNFSAREVCCYTFGFTFSYTFGFTFKLIPEPEEHKFRPPNVRNDVYKYSFFPQTIGDWNRLPPHVACATSLEGFKNQLGVETM